MCDIDHCNSRSSVIFVPHRSIMAEQKKDTLEDAEKSWQNVFTLLGTKPWQELSELMELVAALNRHAPHLNSRALIEAWLLAEVDKQMAAAVAPSPGGFTTMPKKQPDGLVFVHRHALAAEFGTASWPEFRGMLDGGIVQRIIATLASGITENVQQLHRDHPGHNIGCTYTITPSREGDRLVLTIYSQIHAWLAPTN
jgi:hypothetical protein